ncbi:MAG: MarR family transcriptional regulator [Candidatus Saccharibacteria bacterium]|nr:MarR family transcriptional regulator [Candidatus Saccharibacteria bacterium]
MNKPVDKGIKASPEHSVATLQLLTLRRLQALYYAVLADFGMTATDWLLLESLHRHDAGQRMTDIAEYVRVELPLITRLVKAHAQAGLLSYERGVSDRRVKPVLLTSRGKAVVEQIEQELAKQSAVFEQTASKRQLEGYYKTLEHFAKYSLSD